MPEEKTSTKKQSQLSQGFFWFEKQLLLETNNNL